MIGKLPTRFYIGVMIFLTTYTCYTIRGNISIQLVSMVKAKKGQETPYCLKIQNNSFSYSKDDSALPDYGPRYDWDQHQQAFILSGYFYAYILSSFMGGWIAEWIGPFKVILWTHAISAVANSCIPYFAEYHYLVIVALRGIMGVGGGLIYPAIHCLIAHWAPPSEKGKFMASLMGNNIGTCLTWHFLGLITKHFGWKWGFHFVSIQCLLFCIIFYFVCSDSPETHRWISQREVDYILESHDGAVSKTKVIPPFKAILTSKAFWILTICHYGNEWGLYLQLTGVPKFMSEVVGFELSNSGLLSGLPHLARMIFGMSAGVIGDYMLVRGLTHNFIRKFFAYFSHLAAGLLMISIAYCGCNYIPAVILLILSMGMNGCASMVNIRNPQDLSPNFAGTINALFNSIGGTTGFIVPAITGALISDYNGIDQWAWIFKIGGAVYITGGVVFILFGTTKLQPWNEIKEKTVQDK